MKEWVASHPVGGSQWHCLNFSFLYTYFFTVICNLCWFKFKIFWVIYIVCSYLVLCCRQQVESLKRELTASERDFRSQVSLKSKGNSVSYLNGDNWVPSTNITVFSMLRWVNFGSHIDTNCAASKCVLLKFIHFLLNVLLAVRPGNHTSKNPTQIHTFKQAHSDSHI